MNYSLLSNSLLVNMLKDSNKLAFKEIYTRYWKELYKTAYTKIHNKELAEEFTQNIFVDLWRRRETISIESLESYLFCSLKYGIINHFKSRLVKQHYQTHVSAQNGGLTENTDHLTLLNDLHKAMNNVIALLPVKTGEVFKLSRLQNCSTKEISQQLNISEKAVEYHITQSLKSMRYHLKEYMFLLITILLFYKS